MTTLQSHGIDTLSSDKATSETTFPWRSETSIQSAAPTKGAERTLRYDIISLLGVAQRLLIDILPITWQPALDSVGEGRTAEIRQALIDLQLNFAFKCIKHDQQDERRVFRELISEIGVLGHDAVRTNPYIVKLEGICFDIPPGSDRVWPVLVFEKSECGDLERFASSSAGAKLSLASRLELCANIGTAVKDLHAYGIIHGDLGPRNVLIFKDDTNDYVAKVSDFGYSTLVAGSGTVDMPRTKPWYAPEWHHRGFTIADAFKMDVFSFGMLCLWLLFHNVTGFPNRDALEEMKFTDALRPIAVKFVERSEELNAAQQTNLSSFFQSTLGLEPSSRKGDFSSLLQYLRPNRDTGDRFEGSPNIRAALVEPHFDIVPSAYQLYLVDSRVRIHIRKSLEETLSCQAPGSKVAQQTAFQLALCYRLGFGVAADAQKSHRLLEQSGEDCESLDTRINLLRGRNQTLRFRDGIFQRTYKSGLVHEIDFDRRYGDHDSLDSIEDEYSRETMDLQAVFGDSHPLLSMIKSRLARILNAHGLWRKSESLCRQVLEHSLKLYGRHDHNTLMSMEALAAAQSNLGQFSEAETLEKEVVNISQTVFGAEHPDTLTRISNLAATYREQGRWDEAELLFVQVLKGRENRLGPENPHTLTSMANLGWLYRYKGQLKEAEHLESKVVETRKRVLGVDYPDTLAAMTNLGGTYLEQGRLNEAVDLFSQVMEKNSEVLGAGHPDTLSSMSHLASAFARQGEYNAAEELQNQVHVLSVRVLGPEHLDTLSNMGNLALTYRNEGRWEEAESLIIQVRDIRKKIMGEEHRDTLLSSSVLASVYLEQGRIAEAEELGTCVLASTQAALGDGHPDTLRSFAQLASVYRDQGRWKEAEGLFNRAVEGFAASLGPEHHETLDNKAKLALVYLHQDRLQEADASLAAVAEIQEYSLGSEHPDTVTTKANLALTKRYLGKLKEAEELEVDILDVSRRTLGPEHPDTIVSMANLALTLADQGKLEEAEDLNQSVVRTASTVLGPEHPNSLTSMYNLVTIFINQQRWDEAEPLAVQVLEARKKVLGQEHPETDASARQWMAILKGQGRLEHLIESVTKDSGSSHVNPDLDQERGQHT